jgi:hypothetical protein
MPVTKRDNLLWHTAMVQRSIRKLLDDITEDEAFVTIGSSPNHICWLTGHIVSTATLRLRCLNADTDTPAEWMALFGRGASNSRSRSELPPFAAVRDQLYKLYDQADRVSADCTDDYLDSMIETIPNWKDRAANYLAFFLTHDFYHAGQIAMIRRELGRSSTFG